MDYYFNKGTATVYAEKQEVIEALQLASNKSKANADASTFAWEPYLSLCFQHKDTDQLNYDNGYYHNELRFESMSCRALVEDIRALLHEIINYSENSESLLKSKFIIKFNFYARSVDDLYKCHFTIEYNAGEWYLSDYQHIQYDYENIVDIIQVVYNNDIDQYIFSEYYDNKCDSCITLYELNRFIKDFDTFKDELCKVYKCTWKDLLDNNNLLRDTYTLKNYLEYDESKIRIKVQQTRSNDDELPF